MSYIKEGHQISPIEYKILKRFEDSYNEHGARTWLTWLLSRCKLQDINSWLLSVKETLGAPLPVEPACSNMYDEHIKSLLQEEPNKNTMQYHAYYDFADVKKGLNTDFYGGYLTSPLIKNSTKAAKDVFDAENPDLALVMWAIKAIGPRYYAGQGKFTENARYDYQEGSYAIGNIICFDRDAGQFRTMDKWIGIEGYTDRFKRMHVFENAANNFCTMIAKQPNIRAAMVQHLVKTK